MIRRWCALCLITVLAVLVAGRAQTSPAHVSAKDDYSKEAAVIEELSTKIAFDNDGELTHEQISRVRVQTDAGVQQWGCSPFHSSLQQRRWALITCASTNPTAVSKLRRRKMCKTWTRKSPAVPLSTAICGKNMLPSRAWAKATSSNTRHTA